MPGETATWAFSSKSLENSSEPRERCRSGSAAHPRAAKVCLVDAGIAKPSAAQVRLAQVGPGECAEVKQSPAHVGLSQAGAP